MSRVRPPRGCVAFFGTGLVATALGASGCGSILGDFDVGDAADASTGDSASPDASAVDGASGTDSATGGDGDAAASLDATAPGDAAHVTDSSPDGDAASWSPTQIGGLALWLDAMSSVTYDGANRVLVWGDRSGGSNNAAPSSCTGPLRAAASQNGRDTLVFDGAANCLRVVDAASLQFGAGDFAVFVVARYANVPTFGQPNAIATLFAKRPVATAGTTWVGAALFANTISPANTRKLSAWQGNVTGNIATGATDNLNDNAYRRFGMARRGTALEVYVNGVLDGTQAVSALDVSAATRPVWIGGEPDQGAAPGVNFVLGNLAEVVAVKGTVTAAQIAQLDAYLKTKWGL